MTTTIKPVVYKTQEVEGYIDHLSDDIKAQIGTDADLLLSHPAIYVHVWQNRDDILNGTWSIYIGETNDIIERTKQHWNAAKVPLEKRSEGNWQYHLIEDTDDKGNRVIPTVYFIGHKLFHKSLTLDIENKLIDFCLAMETAHTHNGRGNAQGSYCGDDNFDDIFSMIWKELRKDNSKLFLKETSIQKSAIYKASPNHLLTEDQKKVKQLIIDRAVDAILTGKSNQLIFVEGEAGTGKTVLTSNAFYGILEDELLSSLNLSCFLLINHEEQRNVYKNMARKLGYPDAIVQPPTTFLKNYSVLNPTTNKYLPSSSKKADLVFVDEAHLLWNQNNQAFNTGFDEPQLDEIMKRTRLTVIMFDENQVLHKGQISTMEYMIAKRNLAKSQGPNPRCGEFNYIQMTDQLRMKCSKSTMKWVDDLSKKLIITSLSLDAKHRDSKGYEVLLFDTPSELHDAIKKKARNAESQLSRVIATYDWKYIDGKMATKPKKYWQLDIDGWTLPWNEQLYHVDIQPTLNKRQKKKYEALDWAEKDYTVNEAGSTFTIQGFDLAYAGVILGPSVRYDKEKKRIWFDESLRAWNKMTGKRKLQDGTAVNVTDTISQHELRVLLTRGTKGLYIYACDKVLRETLKNAMQ